MKPTLIVTCLLWLCIPATSWAQWRTVLGAESRLFPKNAPSAPLIAPIRSSNTQSTSGTGEFEWGKQSADRKTRFLLTGYGRFGARDDQRNHIDVREFWLSRSFANAELGVGITREFWGVTESAHIVNPLNQIDALEDIDAEDYLGQPMLKTTLDVPNGSVSAYVLPYFREKEFPQNGARLSTPIPVSRDAQFESGADDRHVDWAIRYELHTDFLDLGVHHFSGTDREPFLQPTVTQSGAPILIPHYRQIRQWGVDAQLTLGSWLFKLEALQRWGQDEPFAAQVVGFEYTQYQVGGSSADLGWVLEYLKDDRDQFNAPATFLQDDIFVGLRLGFNNTADTQLLAGYYHDTQTDEQLLRVEFSHRFGSSLTLEVNANGIFQSVATSPLYPIRRDSFLSTTLRYHLGG